MNSLQALRADNVIGNILSSYSHLTGALGKEFQLFTSLFILALSILALGLILLIGLRIYFFLKSLKDNDVLLELTPPSITEQSAYSTEQLFQLINSLGSQRSLKDVLLGLKPEFSIEIVSTKSQGIRYLLRTGRKEAGALKKSFISYLPQVKVSEVDDYLSESLRNPALIEFKLLKHFAFPLKTHSALEEHDPISYITGMMTKLEDNELVSLQIVLTTSKSKKAQEISNLIFRNKDVLNYINMQKGGLISSILSLIKFIAGIVFAVLSIPFWVISNIATNGNTRFPKSSLSKPSESFRPTTHEKLVIDSIKEKLDQGLFDSSIRLLVSVESKSDLTERVRGFKSSLASFTSPENQRIVTARSIRFNFYRKFLFFLFKNRLISFLNSSILSVSEVSGIYHFPYTSTTKTENIVKTYSKELPAPLSLKGGKVLDVSFGKNLYGGSETLIGLSEEEREKHMYIIGATGSGKTTLITSMVSQDIKNGKGVAVIDPHGDLAETLLTCIPKARVDDLIYVNPDDLKYPIGINLLELSQGLDEDDLLREKEFITESVISLFRKVFSESMAGHAHRIEYILRNAIQTALTLENPTLFTIYELLNNPPFQKQVTKTLEDENLKNFWKYEYGKAGDYQKVKMISPVAARIGRFLFSPSAKRMLEQRKSTINFDDILDKQKILICNLAKGKLGEDTSEVLGIMIVAKIQLASLRRARIREKERKPFYLYVDEFQNFATASFIQMLSEARKYKTFLVMAEQSTSQQKDKNLVNVILANVGTVISFRSANPEDERLMLPQFSPFIERGDIANLPRYNFYIKISAVNPEESFSGTTIPNTIAFDRDYIQKLIKSSRDRNAILYVKPVTTALKRTVKQPENTTVQDVSLL